MMVPQARGAFREIQKKQRYQGIFMPLSPSNIRQMPMRDWMRRTATLLLCLVHLKHAAI
jgi:hypothetical protein